jgi:DNA-directed RNA polymerase specialized sigma24 family protein
VISRWRAHRWIEAPLAGAGDPASNGPEDAVVLHVALWRELASLPPRMRAVVVLRFVEDLSEAQTAATLGCSVGSVKSQSSRALARLRTRPRLAGLTDQPGHDSLSSHPATPGPVALPRTQSTTGPRLQPGGDL